jgi:hypothetical protein|tara:strand:+ start:251 stop:484 length:234 start_codon:yes stop_codon:yes gene_type:complete
MSNKPEHRTYFRELIRKLKELRISADTGEIIVTNDDGDVLAFNELDIPFHPEMFEVMSPDEKEALFIWLNKENMPQA